MGAPRPKPQEREGEPRERGGRRKRGEAEGEERGGPAQDDRTDTTGTPRPKTDKNKPKHSSNGGGIMGVEASMIGKITSNA